MSNLPVWQVFDLNTVTTRFAMKSPYGKYAAQLELETRRFLKLCAGSDKLAPSPLVDEFWHALILNTALYRTYCLDSFGKIIEHQADLPERTEEAKAIASKRYQLTLDLYSEIFGDVPDSSIWPRPEGGALDQIDRYKSPHRLHIESTNHCNLACEHCYRGSSSSLPHHPIKLLTNVLAKLAPTKIPKITLTGGELLTRDDWKELVQLALDRTDNLYFITNGLLLSKQKINWLNRQRVFRSLKQWKKTLLKSEPVEIGLAISLDGLWGNEMVRVNDKGVGVKASQIISKIALAVKHGLHVTVNTTVTNETTASELPEMYDILNELGIDRWQIDQAYAAGRYASSSLNDGSLSWLNVAKESYRVIVARYLKDMPRIPSWRLEIVQVFRYDTLFHGFHPAASVHEHPCAYQFGSVIVEEGDEVRFCPSLRNAALGRALQTETVSALYQTPAFTEFASHSISHAGCQDCRYALIFHGGCRANSLAYTGKMWTKDPICCSLSPFVEDEIVPLLPPTQREQFFASLTGGTRPDAGTEIPGKTKSRRKIVIPINSVQTTR